MTANFKQAEAGDFEKILEMMEHFYAIDAYPFDKEKAKANLEEFTQNKNLGRLWTIQYEGQTIGYVVLTFCFSFEFKGRDAFIDELYIVKGFRGRGLGTQAIEFAYEQAKTLGIKAIHLEVENHNKPGMRLYNSFGFKEHNRMLMTKIIT